MSPAGPSIEGPTVERQQPPFQAASGGDIRTFSEDDEIVMDVMQELKRAGNQPHSIKDLVDIIAFTNA
ncbi:hypothetical protein LTR41_011487, partial [Exophiala xenobiotica]